jgi:serine/threonine protein kinase
MTRELDPGKTHCSTTSLGTITHVAPEVLLSGKQTKAGDVYSFGMLSELLDWGALHASCIEAGCYFSVMLYHSAAQCATLPFL